MTSRSRIAIGTVLLVLIVAAGFLAGYFAKSFSSKPQNNLETYTAEKPNNRIYDVSPPSIGKDLETYDLPDLKFTDGIFYKSIPADDAATLAKGLKVLLYGKDGKILEALGEVTSIGENLKDTDENKTLVVSFAQPGMVDDSQVYSGRIALYSTSNVRRLPLTAVVQDENKNTFLWEVRSLPDGSSTAYLKSVKVILSRPGYVGIEVPADYSNLYIINPDKNLKDGQFVRIQEKVFEGPGPTEDARIQAMLDNYLEQRELQIDYNKEDARRFNAAAGCGVTPNYAKQFSDRINAVNEQTKTNTRQEPEMSKPGYAP